MPMSLQNMRENGPRSVSASCSDCHHTAAVNVDHLAGHVTVPSLSRRFVCTGCGGRRIDVRPAWHAVPVGPAPDVRKP